MRAQPSLAVLLALALSGCVHAPTPAPRPAPAISLEADPVQVSPDKIDLLLASMNDEELFTKGSSSYASGDFTVAAKAFDRLCDLFPQSVHFAAASYNAGLAHEQLASAASDDDAEAAQWQAALERYRPLLDIEKGTGDQIDAGFRAAECLYHLGAYADAIQLLQRIQARTDLSKNVQLEAQTQIGICQVEAGDLSSGETTLREVMRRFDAAGEAERLDDFYPAQAQFFLGEIYRSYFEQVVLDPNKPALDEAPPSPKAKPPTAEELEARKTERLAKDLEYKAEMLLSAQGHYLRAIRVGNAQWATASGERIGQLYETMYDAMTQAPAPTELDAEQSEIYRQELRKKVRVLVTKAINIYESTLEAAERTGSTGPFIEKAKASLERMKQVLLADAKGDAESPPASEPTPAKKTEAPAAKKQPSSARVPPVANPVARR
jgi:tetratricopeptide (TPR) repeat protein